MATTKTVTKYENEEEREDDERKWVPHSLIVVRKPRW